MSSYYESGDLAKFGDIGKHAPALADEFFKYYASVTGTDGALSKRETALIALAVAHADGSIGRFLIRLSRIDILLLDDFAMAPLKDAERRDVLEICDDRYQRRSLILTSQMPVAHSHEQIGDPTIADSILDRLIHNAYRIELKGESMRKKRRKPGEDDPQ